MNYSFELTKEFKNLGITIVNNNRGETEKYRLKAADRCFWSLNKLTQWQISKQKNKYQDI